MLKAVSSIANAIGALNYRGAWDAATNTPALTSSVGTKGDYYVVSVPGATVLDGISNWGVGDWAVFNGVVWERVEGGTDLNGVNLSVSGTSTLSDLTASTALAINESKEIVSVTNTGSDNNVLASSPSITTPTLVGDVTLSTGNLVIGTSGNGIDFSATSGTGTSELFDDYEEGEWTPSVTDLTNTATPTGNNFGYYTKIGRTVTLSAYVQTSALNGVSGLIRIGGLPFTIANTVRARAGAGAGAGSGLNITAGHNVSVYALPNTTNLIPMVWDDAAGSTQMSATEWSDDGGIMLGLTYVVA